MESWKLWFYLLLPLIIYIDSQVIAETPLLVKTVGNEPDATPVCANHTQDVSSVIICWIKSERIPELRCLRYRHGNNVESCDPRFTLTTENQTVFLLLTSLTSEDSGNYTCQCANTGGTHVVQLNITVEGAESVSSPPEKPFLYIAIVIIVLVIVTGGVLGCICRKLHHRQRELMMSHVRMEPGDIEPYSTYIQTENDLYSFAMMSANNIIQ